MNANSLEDRSDWLKIWVAFLAGCIAAFQIGKSAASLALIIDELGLSLFEAGLIVSLFTLVGALCGAAFGFVADRIGHLRTALAGLSISAAGSLLGAQTSEFSWLLATRLLEGFGFILAIVALPSLISRSASAADRPLAMGLWGAFMPAGIGASMLITPQLVAWHGWRGLWSDVGIVMLLWCLLLALAFRGARKIHRETPAASEVVANALRAGPLLLVGGFVCYSALYQPVTAFFPTLLITDRGLALGSAAYLGALVAVANVVGNLAAGWLIGRGVAPTRLLLTSFTAMGVFAALVFAPFTDPAVKTLCGIAFSAGGGLFPGTAFALAPRFAARPSHIALMSGLLLQGAGIGQTIGPLIVSGLVEHGGAWHYAGIEVALMAGVGLLCAGMLRRSLVRTRET
ncbi:MAG TPA: MFS transporter [Gammaproteobacteria bacterium]|nr:MFS transporter [Gammaproteobacteria bacterium]